MSSPSNSHPVKTTFAVIFLLIGVLIFAGSGLCTVNTYRFDTTPSQAGYNDLTLIFGLITMAVGFVVGLVGWLMWRSAHKRRN